MRKLWLVFLFFALFSACAQTPPENSDPEPPQIVRSSRTSRGKEFYFRVDASCQTLGFNIIINGVELVVVDGGGSFTSKIEINDWMVSGTNKLDITITWPDSVQFSPNVSSASFKLYSNDKLLKEFNWSASKQDDSPASYPHTFTENFKADGFPKVKLERAERIISSAGILPREDQEDIAAIAQQLRKAFTEKDFIAINELFSAKYEDLATARFSTSQAVKAEADKQYRELMGKAGYAVLFNGRNTFFSIADDRVVRLGQGRIGFPESALIFSWREGGRTVRKEMDLYFSKIDGKWVIIR